MILVIRSCVCMIFLAVYVHAETFIVDWDLPSAIEAANALPGKDTILFSRSEWYDPPGWVDPEYPIYDTLVISDDLEIINEDNRLIPWLLSWEYFDHRIMLIEPGVKVLLSRIGIKNGGSDNGAGLYVGTDAIVEIEYCFFHYNLATERGGAIYNDGGTLLFSEYVSIRDCKAQIEGGGIYNKRGSIISQRPDKAFFLANFAGERGGAIYIDDGIVIMDFVDIGRNQASFGGALYLSSGSFQAHRATFSSDSRYPGTFGGGLFIAGGTASLVNATFCQNQVTESGGGIAVQGGVAEVINCTFTENQAGSEKAAGGGAGIYVYPSGEGICRIGNTIVAGNTAIGSSSPDVLGPFESLGHNLIGVVDGATGFDASSDRFGTISRPLDARLGDARYILNYFGIEYPLLRGSPALNAGDNGLIRAPWFEEEPFVDIIGLPRTVHTQVDIGSSEASYTGYHKADYRPNFLIDLSEVLRVIQFYNSGGFHCAEASESTEDGYVPGPGETYDCAPHHSDYNPPDWSIDLTELLRLVQFYNTGVYYPCSGSEDGFCL